jgi:hypothetical protein
MLDEATAAASPYDPAVTPGVQLVQTRHSLHVIAEHVLAPARYAATGRIGLRVVDGGFGTPPFETRDGTTTQVCVRGVALVVVESGVERTAPITNVRAAAAFVGVEPGAPANVYEPATPLDLDRPLDVDPHAASELAEWFALGNDALDALCSRLADEDPADVQLWPEHFDVATTISQVNYGASPGDPEHTEPYLYVGPWDLPAAEYWNEPFGASRPRSGVRDADAALAFFLEGRERARRDRA